MVRDIMPGSAGTDIFLCTSKQQLLTKKMLPYLKVELRDKTGTINAVVWDLCKVVGDFSVGSFVQVDYSASVYNDTIQLSLSKVQLAKEGTYKEADFLPTTNYDVREMYSEIVEFVGRIKSSWLRTLLHNIFSNSEVRQMFVRSSAAKTVHHAFVGGLLQHTLENVRLADSMASLYPEVNRDIVISACLLHDIGKLQELSPFPENDYTDAGQYLGHVYMSASYTEQQIAKIDGFPEILKVQLLHCILAHHDELEYGSPVTPKTLEAYIVSMSDLVGSKIEIMREGLPEDESWSPFLKYYGGSIRRSVDWGEFN